MAAYIYGVCCLVKLVKLFVLLPLRWIKIKNINPKNTICFVLRNPTAVQCWWRPGPTPVVMVTVTSQWCMRAPAATELMSAWVHRSSLSLQQVQRSSRHTQYAHPIGLTVIKLACLVESRLIAAGPGLGVRCAVDAGCLPIRPTNGDQLQCLRRFTYEYETIFIHHKNTNRRKYWGYQPQTFCSVL